MRLKASLCSSQGGMQGSRPVWRGRRGKQQWASWGGIFLRVLVLGWGKTAAQRGKPQPKVTLLDGIYHLTDFLALSLPWETQSPGKDSQVLKKKKKSELKIASIYRNSLSFSAHVQRANSHLKILRAVEKSPLKGSKMSNLLTLKCNFKGDCR